MYVLMPKLLGEEFFFFFFIERFINENNIHLIRVIVAALTTYNEPPTSKRYQNTISVVCA
jgi:hypothetical protein